MVGRARAWHSGNLAPAHPTPSRPPLPKPLSSRRPIIFPLALGLLLGCAPPALAVAPHHDHVVVVVMENKSYDEARGQPYTSSLLAAGATLTNSIAVTHPSQPNYFAL